MIAFHGKEELKKEYLGRVRAHRAADQLVKGQYWENGKGCAVGCTIHSGNHGDYAAYDAAAYAAADAAYAAARAKTRIAQSEKLLELCRSQRKGFIVTRLLLIGCLLLGGCISSNTPMEKIESSQSRISVERLGVFTDGLAYSSQRGIYLIRDKKTGKEFVGISGVGICETGLHSNGKTSFPDER